MGRLLQRLIDPARSGVYRATRADEILDAVRGSRLELARAGGAEKSTLLQSIAQALGFPDWFGQNWDALEDCLTDLSWRKADGYVLILDSFPQGDDLGVLTDILASVAEFWAGRGKPFFAVFIDPQRKLGLPDLFRQA